MAFADSLRSSIVTMNDVADLLEDLLATTYSVNGSSVINTTSGSYVDFSGASLAVDVVAGEKVLVFGKVSLSHGTTNGECYAQLARDSSGIGVPTRLEAFNGETSGEQTTVPFMTIDNPGAGSYTYKIQWATTSGTMYGRFFELHAIKLRIS